MYLTPWLNRAEKSQEICFTLGNATKRECTTQLPSTSLESRKSSREDVHPECVRQSQIWRHIKVKLCDTAKRSSSWLVWSRTSMWTSSQGSSREGRYPSALQTVGIVDFVKLYRKRVRRHIRGDADPAEKAWKSASEPPLLPKLEVVNLSSMYTGDDFAYRRNARHAIKVSSQVNSCRRGRLTTSWPGLNCTSDGRQWQRANFWRDGMLWRISMNTVYNGRFSASEDKVVRLWNSFHEALVVIDSLGSRHSISGARVARRSDN
ncbi:hypothetical protein BDN71DRAFT_1498262 [Pleurotus eryngii]|uniref:Uncharacterized protein n=1 Tax=Pleurotus eryngii TaxID=5323 RepID=A0A9P5ZNB4_PLEER|nr:hypothetical protein BDN71DRAFT_1498262 [Pleurotus eryngii]